jgi:hypothetical protein
MAHFVKGDSFALSWIQHTIFVFESSDDALDCSCEVG